MWENEKEYPIEINKSQDKQSIPLQISRVK